MNKILITFMKHIIQKPKPTSTFGFSKIVKIIIFFKPLDYHSKFIPTL